MTALVSPQPISIDIFTLSVGQSTPSTRSKGCAAAIGNNMRARAVAGDVENADESLIVAICVGNLVATSTLKYSTSFSFDA